MRPLLLGGALLLLAGAGGAPAARPTCPAPRLPAGYAARVETALASPRDDWGEAVIRRGPSYTAVRRYLQPLFLVGKLTRSGVYYLPFGRSLHVADGSEIVRGRAHLWIDAGGERYGACLARLTTPRLAGGWLPILETSYTNAAGRRYRQESFASGASYVRLTTPGRRTVYLAFDGHTRTIDAQTYDTVRAKLVSSTQAKLAAGASITVPDARVNDAVRNLLVQNLALGFRYSVGNAYALYEFPESLAASAVLGEYGFFDAERAIVEGSFRREPHLYPNWEAGQRLLESARYVTLSGDRAFLTAHVVQLRRYVRQLATRIGANGLLPKERYASDLADSGYSLNGQAVCLQGLRAIDPLLPDLHAGRAADRLQRGLRAALDASERRLPDGSIYVPARLLAGEQPYDRITTTRVGSYWNLVVGDALASGVIAPHSAEARGILRYLDRHGSRLLGMLRFDYGRPSALPGYRAAGTDDVYLLPVERFLADNDDADRLALSLYGQLAAGMTENTFVSGEGATVAPVAGERFRELYLPPNSASNAAFLETVRLALVHETARGLELGFATPRSWLAAGKRIAVRDAATRFGRISFELAAHETSVTGSVTPPPGGSLRLRLRLPAGKRIGSVTIDGRPYARVDRATATIDFGHLSGPAELDVQLLARS